MWIANTGIIISYYKYSTCMMIRYDMQVVALLSSYDYLGIAHNCYDMKYMASNTSMITLYTRVLHQSDSNSESFSFLSKLYLYLEPCVSCSICHAVHIFFGNCIFVLNGFRPAKIK